MLWVPIFINTMLKAYLCTFQDSGDLSVEDFGNPQSTPVIRTADVQRGLDLFAPWLHADNKQPFLLVGPEGCGKGCVLPRALPHRLRRT